MGNIQCNQENAAAEDIMYHNLKQMRFMIIYSILEIIYEWQKANFNITFIILP